MGYSPWDRKESDTTGVTFTLLLTSFTVFNVKFKYILT